MRIIVPYAVNGGTDVVSRIMGRALERDLGQPVFIENILGGSGAGGMIAGAASIPDGYTMTMVTRELVSLPEMGMAEINTGDFRLLGLVNLEPAILVVRSDSPYRSLGDLIETAERKPGKLKFASAAKPHFYVLEFEDRKKISFNKIPYNGAAMAIPAVARGDADFTLANYGEIWESLEGGQIRALAVMHESRMSGLESVPTFRELGIDIISYTWRGLVVPAGTPDSVYLLLENAVRKACADPEFIQEMKDYHYRLSYKNPEEFMAFIEKDRETIRNILKQTALQ